MQTSINHNLQRYHRLTTKARTDTVMHLEKKISDAFYCLNPADKKKYFPYLPATVKKEFREK